MSASVSSLQPGDAAARNLKSLPINSNGNAIEAKNNSDTEEGKENRAKFSCWFKFLPIQVLETTYS